MSMTSTSPPNPATQTTKWLERVSFDRNWLIAVSGVIFGAVLDQAGMRVEGGATAVLGFAPLYLSLERRLFPGLFFGPLTFMFFLHALEYGIGPLGQILVLDTLFLVEKGFVPAQWGGVLGLTVFAIIFSRVFCGVLRRIPSRWKEPLSDRQVYQWGGYAIVMVATGVVVLGYGLVSGAGNRLGGMGEADIASSSLGSVFFGVHEIMFFFLGYFASRRKGWWWWFWMAILVAYSIFFWLDGTRGMAVIAAICSAMGFAWAGTSWRKIILVGAIAAIGFVPMAGVVRIYREFHADLSSKIAFRDRVVGLLEAAEVFRSESGGALPYISRAFFEGISAQSVDEVFLQTPGSIPFAGFDGIENVVWVFVPTILYPGRPELSDGNALAILYNRSYPEDHKGAYMPAVGDGYRRGGWTGVVLLYSFSAFIFGSALALCWARRAGAEWMAMLVWLSFQATNVFSSTMLNNFWLFLWAFPRQWAIFWLLRQFQRLLFEIGMKVKVYIFNFRTT